MANALRLKDESRLQSTIEFCEKFNDAFDALNVRYKYEGQRQRKKFSEPYTHPDDWRFEVGETRSRLLCCPLL